MDDVLTPQATMPDIARQSKAPVHGLLDWVGMSDVAMPVSIHDSLLGPVQCHAKSQVYINLADVSARGIHMSRLYLGLYDYLANSTITSKNLRDFLSTCIQSHDGISDRACLSMRFDLLSQKPSLKSQLQGWQSYPVTITATLKNNHISIECELEMSYGSTCPCSASLARQLIERKMQEDFKNQNQIDKGTLSQWLLSERGTYATAHGQRCYARMKIQLDDQCQYFPLWDTIQCVEKAIKTPSQTAVKRQDEQAFAERSGQNLMFCEDAARIIHQSLSQQKTIHDFWLQVKHLESLHAHDAVAMVCKGIPTGYGPTLT